jgi:hypothetical protein
MLNISPIEHCAYRTPWYWNYGSFGYNLGNRGFLALRGSEFKELLLIALTNHHPVPVDFGDLTDIMNVIMQPEKQLAFAGKFFNDGGDSSMIANHYP